MVGATTTGLINLKRTSRLDYSRFQVTAQIDILLETYIPMFNFFSLTVIFTFQLHILGICIPVFILDYAYLQLLWLYQIRILCFYLINVYAQKQACVASVKQTMVIKDNVSFSLLLNLKCSFLLLPKLYYFFTYYLQIFKKTR